MDDEVDLKASRLAQGMTLAAMAAKLGVSKAAVSGWELGDWYPEAERVPAVAKAYKVSPVALGRLISRGQSEKKAAAVK